MYNQRVMEIINNVPRNAILIDGRWIFTTKDDRTKKVGWVAKGFRQREGIDYNNTYSPAVQADSLRITIAIAARYNWKLKQLDIKASYLNAKLKEKIYIIIPKGDKNYNKGKYWLLKKALYGLKQAGREWNKEISKFLISIGHKQINTDKFTKYKNNKLSLVLSLYIDDILLTGTNEEIKYVSNKLHNKYQISKYTNANKII